MTREEKFKKEYELVLSFKGNVFYDGYLKGVKSGIEFADKNPQWHKYPEEEPPKIEVDYDEYELPVIVQLKDGTVTVGIRDNYSKRLGPRWYIFTCTVTCEDDYMIPDDEVIAWMELPRPFKCD